MNTRVVFSLVAGLFAIAPIQTLYASPPLISAC
jgi:hypothetical protein